MVKVGTPVKIIYEPVLLAHLDDGRIFLEANPDIYGLAPKALDDLQTLAVSNHIGNMIDWQRVREGLERKDGLARDVTSRVATPILSTSSLSPILSPAFWDPASRTGLYANSPNALAIRSREITRLTGRPQHAGA